MTIDNTVSLEIGGLAWTGWENVRITRALNRIPSDFSLVVTERDPTTPRIIDVQPGQSVVVKIGADVVITGYVDRYEAEIDASSHRVEIMGRGRCQDLVDCAAQFAGQQISMTSIVGIASEICAPFGISVTGPNNSRIIPQFNTVLTETGHAVIERLTRYTALIAYEGNDGNLVLGPVGTTQAASGFALGSNVQSSKISYSMDQRYSVLIVIKMPFDTWHDPSITGSAVGISNENFTTKAIDYGVPRYRPHLIVSEQPDSSGVTAQQRADWEINRRWGESQAVTLVTDSWRDAAGALWQINTLASVNLPALKLVDATWLISSVTFLIDDKRGTIAEITLMPPVTFSPEPIVLAPFDQQLAQDLGT